jgi:hypothetical protein
VAAWWWHSPPPTPPTPEPPEPVVLERLRHDGMIRRTASGHAWRYRGLTAFRAAERHARGEDLTPFFAWARARGVNTLRIFCQWSFFAPDWRVLSLGQLRAFGEFAGAHGFYIAYTVLTDCQRIGPPDLGGQTDRIAGVIEAVADLDNTAHVEFANEPFKNTNGVAMWDVAKLLGYDDPLARPCLLALGDYWSEDLPVGPSGYTLLHALDSMLYHQPRKPDWPNESAKDGRFYYEGWEKTGTGPGYHGCGPDAHVISDEPQGCGDPARRDNDPAHYEDAAGGYAIGCAGGTFHCDSGIDASVPDDVETACATAFFGAMDFFDGEAPTGTYTHDGLADYPLLSTAGVTAGEGVARLRGGHADVVVAYPSSAWVPTPVGGWHILERAGRAGQLLKLAR